VTRLRQALVGTSLGASLLISSVQTFAQAPSATDPKMSDSAKAPGSAGPPADEQAAALAYKKAISAYGSKDLPKALQYMQESYGLSGRAELLFNLASLERELQLCQEALRDYQSYLRGVPNGKLRSDAQRATQELQLECPAEPASSTEPVSNAPQLGATAALVTAPQLVAPVEPPSQPPSARASSPPAKPMLEQADDAPYWNTHRVVGWSAIASGVISGGFALYFMNAAIREHDEAAQLAASLKYAPKEPPWLDEQEAQHRDLRAARILGVTAGALVAGGAIALILSPKTHSSAKASATLAAYPGYLGAACSGSF